MNRKLWFGFVCAAAALAAGCDDDGSTSGVDVQAVCKDGEAKCSQEGDLLLCHNGNFETWPCDYGCRAGKCLDEPIGEEADEPGSPCSSSYVNKCRDDKVRLVCDNKTVRSVSCGGDETCVNGECKSFAEVVIGGDCGTGIFVDRCMPDQITRMYCDGGTIKGYACDYGCSEGQCNDDPEDLKPGKSCVESAFTASCKNSNRVRLYCDGGEIKEEFCGGERYCENGVCKLTPGDDIIVGSDCVDDDFIARCKSDDKTRVYCEEGKILAQACEGDLVCEEGSCQTASTDIKPGSPCVAADFTATCKADNKTRIYCDGTVVAELACGDGMICSGGACVPDSSVIPGSGCVEAEFAPRCKADKKTRVYCEGSVVTEALCTGDLVCEGGSCIASSVITPGSPCVAAEFEAKCKEDKKTRVYCNENVIAEALCPDELICVSGSCTTPLPPSEGEACDAEKFTQVCKDGGNVLACVGGVVTLISCGEQECRDGACRSKTCDVSVAPTCDDSMSVLKCVGGTYIKEDCGSDKHCESGACVDNPVSGDECDLTAAKKTCINGTQYQVCEADTAGKGKYKIETCTAAAGGTLCLDDKCVECDPSHYTPGCNSDKNARVVCSADGKVTSVACGSDAPICSGDKCVQCDASSYVPVCVSGSDTQYTSCSADGKIITNECGSDLHCKSGACTGECDTAHPCADHYKCVDGTCVLDKVCEPSSAPVCDGNRIKRCVGLGWYEYENCPTGDTCSGGKCIGHECDSATYGTKCAADGATPQYCADGHIIKMPTCSTGVCIDGICKRCNSATFVENKCYDGNDKYICRDNELYYTPCQKNEVCTEGLGCVSKCGASFKDHCLSTKSREYCTEAGVRTTEDCPGVYECSDGKCVSDIGETCNPSTYVDKCYSNVDLKTCYKSSDGSYKITWRTCGASDFCGSLGGKDGCYRSCDTLGSGTCFYSTVEERAWAAVCSSGGRKYDGTSVAVYAEVESYCSSNISHACVYDKVNRRSQSQSINCSAYDTTCNTSTGMCNGLGSCTTPGGTCSGQTAVSCVPHGSTNVQVSENCNRYTGGKCIKNSVSGLADCYAEVTLDTLGKITTLGVCRDDHSYYRLTNYADGRVEYLIYNCSSSAQCKTGSFSSDGKTYQYAYCE